MQVKEIMTLDVEVASPEDDLQTAARLMADSGAGVLPVCDGEKLVGMITDRDIAVRGVAEGKTPDKCNVRDVMTGEVNFIFEDEDITEAAKKMGEWQVHRLPVLDRQKQLVGIVSLGDLALETEEHQKLAEAVEGIAQPTGKHEQ
ncbi:MAG: CBS domain-containing protein [Thiohalocapsa sp.]